MTASVTARFTSKDIVIQYLPCGLAATHIQTLSIEASISGGTFKLRVNGELTATIAWHATDATVVANINTALDALPNLDASDIVASGATVEAMTLTASGAGNKWFTIEIVADALTGNTSADPNITTLITTQGSILFTVSSDISAFNWEATVETVDVTTISEYARTEIPVAEAVSFDMSIYKATDQTEDFKHSMYAGASGHLTVYPTGKTIGLDVFSFVGLFENYSEDYPDHEKVEISANGMRQGDWVIPPHSVYRG